MNNNGISNADSVNVTDENINMKSNSELDAMFEKENEEEKHQEMSNDKNKVLVKKKDSFLDDGGYGTVIGVVVVIISVCFILSALFIAMLS